MKDYLMLHTDIISWNERGVICLFRSSDSGIKNAWFNCKCFKKNCRKGLALSFHINRFVKALADIDIPS